MQAGGGMGKGSGQTRGEGQSNFSEAVPPSRPPAGGPQIKLHLFFRGLPPTHSGGLLDHAMADDGAN